MEAAKVYARTDLDTGRTVLVKTIGQRLAEFWHKCPASDGWGVTRTAEVMSITLPRVSDNAPMPCVLFTCTIAKNGAPAAQASSLYPISGDKSWERGETNAIQRALNVLGFGAEEISADEVALTAEVEASIAARKKPPLAAVPSASADEQPEPAAQTTQVAAPQGVDGKPRFPPAVPPKTAPAQATVNHLGIRENVFNQVVQRAKMLAVQVPEFGTKAEFDEFRKKLAKFVPGAEGVQP